MRPPAYHDAKEIHDAVEVRHLLHSETLYSTPVTLNKAEAPSVLTSGSFPRELEQARDASLKSWHPETTGR